MLRCVVADIESRRMLNHFLRCSVVAIVGLATACGSSSSQASKVPTTGKRYKIATVGKVEGIAWFDDMKKGVTRFAAETGQDAFMQSPAQADAAQQVQI